MKKIYHIATLGCKVNQQESEALASRFEALGFVAAGRGRAADICVINSCAVTAVADSKTRQRIRQARAGHPGAFVCVIGCLAEVAGDAVASMPEVDLVIGSADKDKAADLIVEALNLSCEVAPEERAALRAASKRTRAFIKAQDGCDRFCAYCIIPYARGPVRSRPMEQVVREADDLLAAGYRELVLTGINLALYGRDFLDGQAAPQGVGRGADLYALTERLCTLGGRGDYRVRLGSLEPTVVDAVYAKAIASLPRVCPHLHLSLQSGAAQTLKAMGRPYTPEDYAAIVRALREIDPLFSITTDVIVGFPGETDTDFENSLDFIKLMDFARVHVFKYSRRPGTKAAAMPGQIAEDIKTKRSQAMTAAAEESAKRFLRSNTGQTRRTLILGPDHKDKRFRGLTDNGIDVRLPADKGIPPNVFTDLVLESLSDLD